MSLKGMTIKEVKKAKINLEDKIMKLINDFEKKTEVRITYISLKRPSSYEDRVEPVKERRGPVKSVEANMELDLI